MKNNTRTNKLIITIDTEEDNWEKISSTYNPVQNIERIIVLQKIFDDFYVKPTYLVTYPVATNLHSVEILKGLLYDGKCEIGMHCHPWNTPPLNNKIYINDRDTMLCNLQESLIYQKLAVLHDTICRNFGVTPVSFRAGRWGFGPAVTRSLCKLGYLIDSSITPYFNWINSHGPDFSGLKPNLFSFSHDGSSHESTDHDLLEVPVTIGFLQSDFQKSELLFKKMHNSFAKRLKLQGLLYHLGLLNRTWLSPELSTAKSMIRLAENMKKNGYSWLNMSFHSTSLLGGHSIFVKKNEEEMFLERIREFLNYCRDAGWISHTLCEFRESIIAGK